VTTSWLRVSASGRPLAVGTDATDKCAPGCRDDVHKRGCAAGKARGMVFG